MKCLNAIRKVSCRQSMCDPCLDGILKVERERIRKGVEELYDKMDSIGCDVQLEDFENILDQSSDPRGVGKECDDDLLNRMVDERDGESLKDKVNEG